MEVNKLSPWVMVGVRPGCASPEVIINVVCEYYGLEEEDLQRKTRRSDIRFPRQLCMYFIREMTRYCEEHLTLEAIGKMFNLHHATVVHSCRMIKDTREYHKELAKQIEEIQDLIIRETELTIYG